MRQLEILKERVKEAQSEDKAQLGQDCLRFYRAAWMDMNNRRVFDKMAIADTYWEGESNQAVYEDDPASNVNIIHPNIEGQVALIVDEQMDVQPDAITPSERPYEYSTKVMMEWIKEHNRLKKKIDRHERRRLKFGVGAFHVHFNPEYLDGFGLPTIEDINPAYMLIDPSVKDDESIDEGRFVILTKTKSISWAIEMYGEVANNIVPGYDPAEDAQLFNEDSGANGEPEDSYIHMLVYIRDKDYKIRRIQMSACGIILEDSFDLEDSDKPYFPKCGAYNVESFPLFITSAYPREGTIWGKSDSELLYDLQDQLNDYDDSIRSAARLGGNPQKYCDPSSGVDPELLTNEEGLIIPAANGQVGYIQLPQYQAEIINRRDRLIDYDKPAVSRLSDQMLGQRQKGVDTATEAMALQQTGMSAVNYKKLMLGDTLSRVFQYCYELAIYYWSSEKVFMITGMENPVVMNPGSLNQIPKLKPASYEFKKEVRKNYSGKEDDWKEPDFMEERDGDNVVYTKAKFHMVFRVGTGMPKNPAMTYNQMKEAYTMKVITLDEYRKYLIERVGIPIETKTPQMLQDAAATQLFGSQPGGAAYGSSGNGVAGAPQQARPNSPMKPVIDSMAASSRG